MPASREKDKETQATIAEGLAATQSAKVSADIATGKFHVADYERTRFQDTGAMSSYMDESFRHGTVRDAATDKRLFRTQGEAKSQYGENWTSHSAETDHIVPLKKVHEQLCDNPFLSESDIREIANSSDNFQALSRRVNASKRDQSNADFIDNPNRKATVSRKGQQNLRQTQDSAESAIYYRAAGRTIKNATITFHNAGLDGAKQSGLTALTMAGIMNVVALVKGEKSVSEAISDTLKTGGTGAVTGYVMSGGLTTLAQGLSKSTAPMIQTLMKSNMPGQIVTALMTFGGTLSRYVSGEIDTGDFIVELGDKGTGLAAGGYGFAVGQALIPIPVLGGVVGSMVGYMLSSTFYGGLVEQLNAAKLAREERLRIERECQEAIARIREYRAQMEEMISRYLTEHITAFHCAFDTMKEALGVGDADGFIAGANMITEKLGGHVQFRNMREFDALMMSDEAFVL